MNQKNSTSKEELKGGLKKNEKTNQKHDSSRLNLHK